MRLTRSTKHSNTRGSVQCSLVELLLGLIFFGRWDHLPDSAYSATQALIRSNDNDRDSDSDSDSDGDI